MSKVKTVAVAEIIEKINLALARPDAEWLEQLTPAQAYRRALASIAELLLHQTGNYHGFSYQDSQVVPGEGLKPDYDETRRIYHGPVR